MLPLDFLLPGHSNDLTIQNTEDVGVLYDVHTGKGHTGPGIIFNTDGISPFKSSVITIWPVLIALTNLPPSIRMNKDNIITVAIWAGESKPPMNTLFESLRNYWRILKIMVSQLQNQMVLVQL